MTSIRIFGMQIAARDRRTAREGDKNGIRKLAFEQGQRFIQHRCAAHHAVVGHINHRHRFTLRRRQRGQAAGFVF
ncbi:hypothetical protein [Klebsiella pneumoniae ISC21]|nr:hypothetical protein [Klebsiella pneumoniae ISC21]